VLQLRLWALGTVGLTVVLAWLASGTAQDGIDQGAHLQMPEVASPPPTYSTASQATFNSLPSAAPLMAQPASSTARHAATAALAVVPVQVTSPQKLQVGEQTELVVGVGANPGLGEVSFTIQFDPDVLQVRAGAPGDWAARTDTDARFGAEISDAADRVRIRSTAVGRTSGAGGSVALVQFQAVAPGTTSVMITDVTVKDLNGTSMPFSISSSNLQVTAESVPTPLPDASRSRGLTAVEPPATETVDTGD
jgi:hypothetical protein